MKAWRKKNTDLDEKDLTVTVKYGGGSACETAWVPMDFEICAFLKKIKCELAPAQKKKKRKFMEQGMGGSPGELSEELMT